LQRQTLFDESDALNVLPKPSPEAICADQFAVASRVVADLSPRNAEALLGGVDLLSWHRQFRNSFLINDVAVTSSRPWIYAAGSPSYGLTMTIRPAATPVLPVSRIGTAPRALRKPADTSAVLGPIVNLSRLAGVPKPETPLWPSEALHGLNLFDVWTAACNPSLWGAIPNAALASAISPILKEKPTPRHHVRS